MLSHSSNAGLFFHRHFNFSTYGKMGVYLFFLISAYLLDRQIALAFVKGRTSTAYWKNYFLRRFLRIYPLFIIALITFASLSYFNFQTTIEGVEDIWQHAILQKGERHFWSIPVEFKYYFLSPILLWFCHYFLKWEFRKTMLFFILAIFSFVLLEFLHPFSRISVIKYLPIFLVGTLIAIYEILQPKNITLRSKKQWSWIGLLALLIVILLNPHYFNAISNHTLEIKNPIYFLPFALLWGTIFWACKYGSWLVIRIFEFKGLRFLGSISYSMYLFHVPVLQFAETTTLFADGIKIYMFFLISIVIAMVSYSLIEKPLSKIRVRG